MENFFDKGFLVNGEGRYIVCDVNTDVKGVSTTFLKGEATIFYRIFADSIQNIIQQHYTFELIPNDIDLIMKNQ